MSWFSEIASKAEAMLVKLDQDAAQVLQNPDEALSGSDESNNAPDLVSAYPDVAYELNYREKSTAQVETSSDSADTSVKQQVGPTTSFERSEQDQPFSYTQAAPENPVSPESNPLPKISQDLRVNPTHHEETLGTDRINGYSKKFTIQSSRRNLFGASPDQNTRSSKKVSNSSHNDARTANLGKKSKDIRDSIKQSLREYASQSNFSPRTIQREETTRSSYTSHFDDQPNLIKHSSPISNHYDNEIRQERLGQSPSLSINVPDNEGFNASHSNDIAARLFRDTAAKRRSLSYVHEILNGLTSPDRQTVLIDQAKFKLRRVQLRGASYARRLNYYFRTYPMMKYAMLIYLIVMQLLVIYVLFFYQSSGSSPGDFSSNVDKLDSGGMR